MDHRPGNDMTTCRIEPATSRMRSQRATTRPPRAPFIVIIVVIVVVVLTVIVFVVVAIMIVGVFLVTVIINLQREHLKTKNIVMIE